MEWTGSAVESAKWPALRRSHRSTFGVQWIIVSLLLCVVLLAVSCSSSSSAGAEFQADDDPTESPNDPPDDEDTGDGEEDERARTFFGDPFRPDSVAVDASSVWVSDAACGVVAQVDKATEEVLGAVTVGNSAAGVAVAAGSVWVGTRDEGSVVRIDPGQRAIRGAVPVPGFALGLSAQGNELWATDPVFGAVYRIDPVNGSLIETVNVGAEPHHAAIGDGTVWVTNQGEDTIAMIDVSRGTVIDLPAGSRPLHVEVGGGSVWVTDSADGAVRRFNERSGDFEAVIDVGAWPHALAYANGAVWVGTETGSFWRIDPATNGSTRIDDADFTSIDTAVDGNNVWIADANGASLIRFDTTTGSIGSVIDLREFGDCETFRNEGLNPPPPRDRSL